MAINEYTPDWVDGYKVDAFDWLDGEHIFVSIEYYKPGQSTSAPPAWEKVFLLDKADGKKLRETPTSIIRHLATLPAGPRLPKDPFVQFAHDALEQEYGFAPNTFRIKVVEKREENGAPQYVRFSVNGHVYTYDSFALTHVEKPNHMEEVVYDLRK